MATAAEKEQVVTDIIAALRLAKKNAAPYETQVFVVLSGYEGGTKIAELDEAKRRLCRKGKWAYRICSGAHDAESYEGIALTFAPHWWTNLGRTLFGFWWPR